MQREIVYGLRLDGGLTLGAGGVGCSALGPRGFLDFLELHTGLRRKPVSPGERLAAFLGFAAQRRDSLPSFKGSFDLDAFATARRLLEWIDTLRLHGWDGSLQAEAPARLHELALLAAGMAGIVPASEAERLAELESALSSGVRLPPMTLRLCEPLSEHAPAWRPVLARLSPSLIGFPPAADPGTDLGQLQRALSAGREKAAGAEPFAGDGSIVIRAARSRAGAARWLAARQARPGELVVLGGGRRLWDEACVGLGQPRPASGEGSAWRPGLQILPLALARLHEPFDLAGSLAFLVHPLCPPGLAGRFLAEGLAEDGGRGGSTWQSRRADYEKLRLSQGWAGNAEDLDRDLETWLPIALEPSGAIPRDLLCEQARSLSKRLRGRLHGDEATRGDAAPALENATEHCARFLKDLDCLGPGFSTIDARLVADLLAVSAEGLGDRSMGRPELGSLPWTEDPAEIAEPWDHQLWFLPERPASPAAWPWSGPELASLTEAGLELPDLAELGARASRGWMRALCSARRGIEIVLPPPGTEPHPLVLLLQSAWPRLEATGIEAELLSGRQVAPAADDGTAESAGLETLARVQLPGPRRWWRLSSKLNLLGSRGFSHTQLEPFLERPAQWLLRYRAGIRNSTILSIPDPATLQGRFAHALVEDLFTCFGDRALTLDESDFGAWFDRAFTERLRVQGASWLEAGQGQVRLRLESVLRTSLLALLGQLRAAGATGIETEKELEGQLFGLAFSGKADLVFSSGSGRRCIVDMKNSRSVARYRDKIADDADIQLSLYAELLVQKEGQVPGLKTEVAYWLIPAATLLSRNRVSFPGAETVDGNLDQAGRLALIAASCAWRQTLLAGGQVEVVCSATASDRSAAAAPPGGLPLGAPFDRFDPYLALYGWSSTE